MHVIETAIMGVFLQFFNFIVRYMCTYLEVVGLYFHMELTIILWGEEIKSEQNFPCQ